MRLIAVHSSSCCERLLLICVSEMAINFNPHLRVRAEQIQHANHCDLWLALLLQLAEHPANDAAFTKLIGGHMHRQGRDCNAELHANRTRAWAIKDKKFEQ